MEADVRLEVAERSLRRRFYNRDIAALTNQLPGLILTRPRVATPPSLEETPDRNVRFLIETSYDNATGGTSSRPYIREAAAPPSAPWRTLLKRQLSLITTMM
ncbi:hypothetical protein EYF80_063151 [Liparis tanakae]|uniref:Uncharacterized protein n=1 Tax=Liparis tanakae TaxID=230148 RepID=A0A4Z2ED93_9TELE|nr:hypothetical protein EYF80_063151 [Liparis tanakae]